MADHNVTVGMHQQSTTVTDEAFSFGALLDKFFQNSPLGKDLTAAQQGLLETKSQDLFMKLPAARLTQKHPK